MLPPNSLLFDCFLLFNRFKSFCILFFNFWIYVTCCHILVTISTHSGWLNEFVYENSLLIASRYLITFYSVINSYPKQWFYEGPSTYGVVYASIIWQGRGNGRGEGVSQKTGFDFPPLFRFVFQFDVIYRKLITRH